MEQIYIESINAIASLIASLLAGTALLYSVVAYTGSIKVSHYNELDKAYQALLSLAFDNIYLVKHEQITTKEQQDKYDIYAFMVWNFLEAIYDKCMKDKDLKTTWEPIIMVEGRMHYHWFVRPDNSDKFKAIFYKYVDELVNTKTVNYIPVTQ